MSLQPDPVAIRAHLEHLFQRVRLDYAESRCEIACSEPGGGAINQGATYPITPEGLDRATQEAVQRNLEGRNLYVGPNPRHPSTAPFGRCSERDVERAYWQWGDIDRNDGIVLLRRPPLVYTMAVTTGRTPNPRVQPYWGVEDPILNLSAWRAQQAAIADYFHADRVIDPARLMRLAGSVSYPPARKQALGYVIEQVTLRTVYNDEERAPVSSEDLYRAFPWPSPRYGNGGNGAAYSGNGADHTAAPQPPPGSDRWDTGSKDPQEYVRNIKAGHNLHNNARGLAAHLVNTGHRDWLIRELLDRLLRPVSDGGTLGQIEELIRSARSKYNVAEPTEETENFDAAPPEPLPLPHADPVGILDPRKRKPREWLVPYRMMRRHITMTTAAPGVGKSTLAIEEAVSIASGSDFLGFGVTRPLRVAIINNEETRDELERRVEATCKHFNVRPEAIADRLFLYSGVDNPKLVLVRSDRRSGLIIPTEQLGQLQALINVQHLDIVILDPFVQLHYVEENSNEQISQALVQLRELGSAAAHPAAIHIIHHNRKPVAGNSHQAGDMASARGAGAMGGEAHFFFTLTDMAAEDAEKLNIPETDRVNFLRLDDAKRKMAPAQGARWFERHGELMPYGLLGEEVGILIPHDTGGLDNSHIPAHTATAMLQTIDAAWTAGSPYSEYPRASGRYVVTVLMEQFKMARLPLKNLLRDWLQTGMVATETRDGHANLRGLRVLKWGADGADGEDRSVSR